MRLKIAVFFLLVFFFPVLASAEDLSSTEAFSKAMSYYDNGNYENALEWFQKDLEELRENEKENQLKIASTYKYIGNCYFFLGQFENDIANQKKSLKIELKY